MTPVRFHTSQTLHIRLWHISLWGLILSLLPSCTKNEFKIEFDLPKDTPANYQIAYYAWDSRGGWWVETTAVLQEGKAIVDGVTRRPTLVYFKDMYSGSHPVALYVERGETLKIAGGSSDPYLWKVTGDKVSEQWAQWRAENAAALRLGGQAAAKAVEAYVKGHAGSRLSALMLLTEFDRRENPDLFLRLWNSLSDDARDPQLIEMTGTPDLSGTALEVKADGKLGYASDPKLKSIILRTHGNGLDTLSLAKAKASLLYFSESNGYGRNEAIDSLRALSKAYPDSARRIIADIYAEPDSMSWSRSIRRDSLTKAVRGWLPRGLADPMASEAGVTRLPWFMVFSKGGKKTYSGPDLKEAAKAFRRSMN